MTHVLSDARATDTKKPYGDVNYADPGYQSDKKKRYPLDSEAHCKAAWSYINMPKNAAKYSPAQVASIKGRIKSAAKKYGIAINEKSRPDLGVCVRSFDFAFEDRAEGGDGRTLEGYAAVYDTPTKIRDLQGDFEETILKGAFTRSLNERTPVLQFEHGRDPRVGAVPIGQIQALRDDDRGLYVRARLYDNPVIEPVRQAIEGRSITGMSFRFDVPEGGDEWPTRDKRTIGDLNAYELGPVVFPAYDTTSVTVRSLLAQLDPQEHRALIRELAAEIRLAVDLDDVLEAEEFDFTWRPDTRSVGGGDLDAEVENDDASQQRSEFSDRIDDLHVKLLALKRYSAYEEEHPRG